MTDFDWNAAFEAWWFTPEVSSDVDAKLPQVKQLCELAFRQGAHLALEQCKTIIAETK